MLPFRNNTKQYELDQLTNERRRQVKRNPPIHCQYNPIELAWAQVKWGVAKKNKTFKIQTWKRLGNEELDTVTQEDWASCVHHALTVQKDNYAKELEPIAISLQDSEIEGEESDDHDKDDYSSGSDKGADDDTKGALAAPLDEKATLERFVVISILFAFSYEVVLFLCGPFPCQFPNGAAATHTCAKRHFGNAATTTCCRQTLKDINSIVEEYMRTYQQ
jgi:hypothetical protein